MFCSCGFALKQFPQFIFVATFLATTLGDSKLKNGFHAYISGTLERKFVPFLSDHLLLELMPVRLGPSQFEFEWSERVERHGR